MGHDFTINDDMSFSAWLMPAPAGYCLWLGDETYRVDLQAQAGAYRLTVDGQAYDLHIARDGDDCFMHIGGVHVRVRYHDPIARHGRGLAAAHQGLLCAPMPCVVLAVAVAPGAQVEAGDTLLRLESMKLEMALKAPARAQVAQILVQPGQTVDRNAPLLRLDIAR